MNAPSPRADHLTVVVQSRDGFLVLVHGGRDDSGAKSDTWTYLVSEDRWLLLAAPALADAEPPPAMYGAVGGYRFLDDQKEFPFLYVTLGRRDDGTPTNEMWVMELATFTWAKVKLDGDIPSPRWGAIGSLERFVKPDGSVQPALIVSHGYGEDGPLSDTYKCSFHSTDPYRATWRRLHKPVGQYSTRAPHPVWMQGATFTSARDLVMFGGCYSSKKHGGICPSRDVWLLKYDSEKTVDNGTAEAEPTEEQFVQFEPETDTVRWQSLPQGPPPRVGAAMAQGLNSFEEAYLGQRDIAVMYSGSQRTDDLPSDQVISMPDFDGGVVDIVSTTSRAWLCELVYYVGREENRNETLARRKGATLSIVRNGSEEELDPDVPNEYYLLFGGELEDGTFSNTLLKLSFDAFVESELIDNSTPYTTRPLVHGILMFLSWGVLMVIGTFSSRFMKDENGQSRYFLVHVCVQILALALAWAGVGIVIYGRRRTSSSFAHAQIGLTLITLASFQPVVAVIGILARLRNASSQADYGVKVKQPLIPRVCLFYHRIGGLLLIVLAAVNITLGLFLMLAPTILWVHWIVYISLVFMAGLILEVIGGRRPPPGEQLQTRASSMNRGGMSRGSSYVGRVARSLKGESTAEGLRRSRTNMDDLSVRGIDEIPPVDEDGDVEVPFEELDKSAPNLAAMEESSTERIEDALKSQELADAGIQVRENREDAYELRERLESEVSSVYTFQDPDTY